MSTCNLFTRLETAKIISKKVSGVFVGVSIGMLIVSPANSITLLYAALIAGNYFLAKFLVVVSFGLYWRYILRFPARANRKFRKLRRRFQNETMIDGIPINELVSYLFDTQAFKREGSDGARATFGLSMKAYTKLAKVLESKEVLIRGEHNSRVLNPKFERSELVQFLSTAKKSKNLSDYVKIIMFQS